MIEERTGNGILESAEILRRVERRLGGVHHLLHRDVFSDLFQHQALSCCADEGHVSDDQVDFAPTTRSIAPPIPGTNLPGIM
jgi:hypothetical protein